MGKDVCEPMGNFVGVFVNAFDGLNDGNDDMIGFSVGCCNGFA